MVEATYRVKEVRKQLYSANGRQPDDEEVAEAAGLSMRRLNAVLMTPKTPRSLDQKVGINESLKLSVNPLTSLFFLSAFPCSLLTDTASLYRRKLFLTLRRKQQKRGY